MKVLILLGSDSDLPVMKKAADVLTKFGVPFKMTVASAHRTPERVTALIMEAEAAGAGVFIAAAGMAAHLAGAVAAQTTKPVIGVPLNASLNGLDALLATAQMPPGVPVATVAIDGAANAAQLAVQILATSDKALEAKLKVHKTEMAESVLKNAIEINAIPTYP